VQSSLGVVLEGGGSTEDRHHCVPGELLDRPPGSLDLVTHRVVEALELDTDALRIAIAGVGRGADQVGKHHRNELALFPRTHEGSVAKEGAAR
jgi:hypothetical protein